MEFTGERITTEIFEYWTLEHLHRYALTFNYIKDKKVVDIASGEGYGSFLMSTLAKEVLGIDISSETVDHAHKKYTNSNLSFKIGSAIKIPVEAKSIDVVVSFETIEHHSQHEEMMQEIKRILKPDGILIISSPDKKYYSDLPGYNNPFHVKELYFEDFKSLLNKYFINSHFYFQKSIICSTISDHNSKSYDFFEGNYQSINSLEHPEEELYNIAISTDSTLSPIKNSFFYNDMIFANIIDMAKDYNFYKTSYYKQKQTLDKIKKNFLYQVLSNFKRFLR